MPDERETYAPYRGPASMVLLLALGYLGAGAWSAFQTPIVGIEFNEQSVIRRVFPMSPAEAAGFRVGDRVLEVDGVAEEQYWSGPHGYLAGARPGESRRFVVERGGERVELGVVLGSPSPRFLYMRLATSIVGLSFLLSGAILFWRRPSRVSGVFYLMCIAMGIQLIYPPSFAAEGKSVLAVLKVLATFTFASMLLYLFLVFPQPSRLVRNRPYLVKAIFSLALLAAVVLIATALLGRAGMGMPKSVLAGVNVAVGGLLSGYVILALAAFLHRYVTTPRGPSKSAIRLMLLGAVLGLLPILCHDLLSMLFPGLQLPSSQYILLLLVVIPLTFTLALFREQPRLESA